MRLQFPTMEEMAKEVAEKAINEYQYNGKTLNQWIEEIAIYSEKQSHSIELPLLVGDYVYTNYAVSGWYLRKQDRPYEVKVVFIGISESPFFNVEYGAGKMWQFKFSDIGSLVFVKREDAIADINKENE